MINSAQNECDPEFFTSVLFYAVDNLKKNNFIEENAYSEGSVSFEIESIGTELAEIIINFFDSLQKTTTDELFLESEINNESESQPMDTELDIESSEEFLSSFKKENEAAISSNQSLT